MCDPTFVTQSKLASSGPDSPRNGSRNNSDTDHPQATPTKPHSQSESSTSSPRPTSSAHNDRLANSTPRFRSRPAPASALSTPLGRSLSMRVSKKEKRWVTRLADPHTPRISTYQDDYQTPEALSLQSLSLETPTEGDEEKPDPNAPTTYRQSYRWQGHRAANTPTPRSDSNKPLLRSVSEDETTNKNSDSSFPEVSVNSSSSRTRSGGSRAYFRNGQSWEFQRRCPEDSPASPGTIHSPPSSSRSSAFFKRNSSSGVISGQGMSSPTDRKPSTSSCEDSNCPVKPSITQQKGVAVSRIPASGNASLGDSQRVQSQKSVTISLKPANRKVLTTNGERVQNPTPQSHKLSKVDRERTARDSQHQTPRQVRASHLQGSTGGSPFVYGSGSGSWV